MIYGSVDTAIKITIKILNVIVILHRMSVFSPKKDFLGVNLHKGAFKEANFGLFCTKEHTLRYDGKYLKGSIVYLGNRAKKILI